MNIVELHKLIDEWAAKERKAQEATVAGEVASPDQPSSQPEATQETISEVTQRVAPEGQRAVRVKTQGDRVFLLDEAKKTRQWVTTPAILEGLGFSMSDVKEIEETEFMGYNMGSAIYKLDVPS